MAESYEGFYTGGGTSFDSGYGNLTGFKLNPATLGFPGSPQSANQVQDVINAIKHGTKTFEVTMLQPDVAEAIPTQHFKEIRALMKLTGVKPSVHGPLIDPAGFGEHGWAGEEGRADNERRLFTAIKNAQVLDPSGKLPFVVHASNGAPGTEWRPGDKEKKEDRFIIQKTSVVNQDTGQAQLVKREEVWRPESFMEKDQYGNKNKDYGKPILHEADKRLNSLNLGEWEAKLTEIAQMNKHAEEIIGAAPMNLDEYRSSGWSKDGSIIKYEKDKDGNIKFDKNNRPIPVGRMPPIDVSSGQAYAAEQMRKAGLFLENAELSFTGAFEKAYKYGTDSQKKELERLGKRYSNESSKWSEDLIFAPQKKRALLDNAIAELQRITGPRIEKVDGKKRIVRGTPKIWENGEVFAMKQASETFGNLAMKSYDEFKNKAPILAIENMMQGGFAFSRAEDMKKLVEMSREKFVEQLKKKGVDEKKAKKIASDKIGVTWDVGHLNLLRKTGFSEKDVVEQTKKINEDKSMVKHIHLTDNFGYADTHLVPGMGNVPTKAILEELEKNGRFEEMKKITEAGGLVQHFRKLPHSMTLAALGSPIYGMVNAGSGGSWNQSLEMQGNYFGGYGTLNPGTHHQYFGAGFTNMPVELGGAMPGGGSRFGGTPMA